MKLIDMSMDGFLRELGSPITAPWGRQRCRARGRAGSGAVLMVSGLTAGKEKYRDSWADMERVGREAADLEARFRASSMRIRRRSTQSWTRAGFRADAGEREAGAIAIGKPPSGRPAFPWPPLRNPRAFPARRARG